MPFDLFCRKVSALCSASGEGVEFTRGDGIHIARTTGGYTITANAVCPSITVVDENRNHCFRATI